MNKLSRVEKNGLEGGKILIKLIPLLILFHKTKQSYEVTNRARRLCR